MKVIVTVRSTVKTCHRTYLLPEKDWTDDTDIQPFCGTTVQNLNPKVLCHIEVREREITNSGGGF
jgi:hypothetical protein